MRQPSVQLGRDPFPYVMGGIIGALLAALMFVLLLLQRNSATPAPAPAPAAIPPTAVVDVGAGSGNATAPAADAQSGTPLPGTAVPLEGTAHVDEGAPITYVSYPPSSGTHYRSVSTYGFFDTQVPDGKLVHNLEHGAIVLYYRPDLPADALATLRGLATGLPPAKYGSVKIVVTPNPQLQAALQVTAWGRALPLSSVDLDEVRRFYTAWVDKGPEDVP